MQYRSAEWKAKVLDPQAAMRWADKIERDDGEDVASDFRRAFNERAVFGIEHSEYRYWATGVHEPDKDAAAKIIAAWMGYSWDGLRDESIKSRGYPEWTHCSVRHHIFQGGKEDLRELARRIAEAQ